jgi:hypothetical protein
MPELGKPGLIRGSTRVWAAEAVPGEAVWAFAAQGRTRATACRVPPPAGCHALAGRILLRTPAAVKQPWVGDPRDSQRTCGATAGSPHGPGPGTPLIRGFSVEACLPLRMAA